MRRQGVFFILIVGLLFAPLSATALTMEEIMPQVPKPGESAQSVVVLNQVTGDVMYAKNAASSWIPASLTKLVTALVVLDTNPNWTTTCVVNGADEVGGARLVTYAGAKYRLQDLFSASLVASANNATNTLANCVGLSKEEFVKRMNTKAEQFGAQNTKFVEPTGIDIANITTAQDMAKIANAAFSTKKIRETLQKKNVTITTFGTNPKKTHYLKTTNLLLADKEVLSLGGKTGYLDESLYNFAGSFKNPDGQFIVTVVLGSPTKAKSFSETKSIVQLTKNRYAWESFVLHNTSKAVASSLQ